MRLVIVSSSEFKDYKLLSAKVDKVTFNIRDMEVHTWEWSWGYWPGGMAGKWAWENGWPLLVHYPDPKHGSEGTVRRNELMARSGQAFVVFWNGLQGAVSHLIEVVREKKKPIKIVRF